MLRRFPCSEDPSAVPASVWEYHVDLTLVLKQGPARTRSLRIRTAETLIGRSRECDVCIPSAAVSRRHCLLCIASGTVTIEDLTSHNGTFLNKERVVSKTVVKPGDQLQIGPLLFTIQFGPTAAAETMQAVPRTPAADTQRRKEAKDLIRSTKSSPALSTPTMPPTNDEDDIEIIMNDKHPLDLPEGDDFRDLLSKLDLE
jgi:pSer/pThr/pTyr-binding forkhead associated (FHA) protein